jgi:hypothetical protein
VRYLVCFRTLEAIVWCQIANRLLQGWEIILAGEPHYDTPGVGNYFGLRTILGYPRGGKLFWFEGHISSSRKFYLSNIFIVLKI